LLRAGEGATGWVVTQVPVGALIPVAGSGPAVAVEFGLGFGQAVVEDRAVVID